jgi:hypothetical protein
MTATSESGKVRFPVYLDPATVKALRMRALEEGTSATKIVERLIAAHLAKTPKRRTKA